MTWAEAFFRMPFKDRSPHAGLAALQMPRRLSAVAVAGTVPCVEAALRHLPLTQLTMCFNELSNLLVAEALAAAQEPVVALEWGGAGEFLLCFAGTSATATAFTGSLARVLPEFTRVHRWPRELAYGVGAGELVFSVCGPDGRRSLRAFGEAIARAKIALNADETRLACASA
jgi:hypothetical protein